MPALIKNNGKHFVVFKDTEQPRYFKKYRNKFDKYMDVPLRSLNSKLKYQEDEDSVDTYLRGQYSITANGKFKHELADYRYFNVSPSTMGMVGYEDDCPKVFNGKNNIDLEIKTYNPKKYNPFKDIEIEIK